MTNLLKSFKNESEEVDSIIENLGIYSNCMDCPIETWFSDNCPACDLKYASDYNVTCDLYQYLNL